MTTTSTTAVTAPAVATTTARMSAAERKRQQRAADRAWAKLLKSLPDLGLIQKCIEMQDQLQIETNGQKDKLTVRHIKRRLKVALEELDNRQKRYNVQQYQTVGLPDGFGDIDNRLRRFVVNLWLKQIETG